MKMMKNKLAILSKEQILSEKKKILKIQLINQKNGY
jgi:hypothetical protein